MHSFNIFTNGDILDGGYKANTFESYGIAFASRKKSVFRSPYLYLGSGYIGAYVVYQGGGVGDDYHVWIRIPAGIITFPS